MVSALDSRVSSPGSGPGWGHSVVFLGKTLDSQCLSPPRCINGYGKLLGKPNKLWEVNCNGLASHSGEIEYF